MTLFWVLWGIAALGGVVAVGFFLLGLNDGSVSSFNLTIWLALLGGITAVLLGSLWLRSHQLLRQAYGVLLIVALPVLLAVIFFLGVLILRPKRWN